ncbi:MAG: hypothetical protein K6A92_00765 [Lachnospiraceae bacterium]|nr:hypothetical protein [Lachnospiraceae bacterium]
MNQTYTWNDYGKKSPFASFLPGIAGEKGIPIWCYYVNRGQAVVSFGSNHKDHAIMEFYPAHVAYQNVKRTGFRTFIKENGMVTEPFMKEKVSHAMEIGMNHLTLREENRENALQTEVTYYTLPNERIGALVRKVTITNLGEERRSLEILDGMPAVICYGVSQDNMKNMTQTAKAWMQAEDTRTGVPYFRVRASIEDTIDVTEVKGGNFAFAMDETGRMLSAITDPKVVFAYDNSLGEAAGFEEKDLAELLSEKQNASNLLPCAFFGTTLILEKGESRTFYELIGQVEDKETLQHFLEKGLTPSFFEEKEQEAKDLAEELTGDMETHTAHPVFDAYSTYTYMDNLLRGGKPILLGKNKVFYCYSRKHGDLERDYNYFAMLPEYYSQGNGNFRDVNQNRRCDIFFHPFIGRENIRMFYNLIQMDGYNPLLIEKQTYFLKEEESFTPGALLMDLEKQMGSLEKALPVFEETMEKAQSRVSASFGEGYWTDHWTYNLDLIKEYLDLFPEQEEAMLYEETYSYFKAGALINPRFKRYVKTARGIRQYRALDQNAMRKDPEKLVKNSKGKIQKSTLMEKLILLGTMKFTALDPYGMGIEMEGGKPGWYDALNGLPGMLGSSVNELCELARSLDYTIDALKRFPRAVKLFAEFADFFEEIRSIAMTHEQAMEGCGEKLDFWNAINDKKEAYRKLVYNGVSGEVKDLFAEEILAGLCCFRRIVGMGIRKAIKHSNGICPSYYYYDVTDFAEKGEEIIPLHFVQRNIPYFLEGVVRYLKLPEAEGQKEAIYEKVKNSDLYDRKLSMYKVNASLEDVTYEAGRCTSFTPGWLENESIWLHMEYKYLLELIRSGLYKEFFEDLKAAAIPFLDEETYGRSLLENSSFIASSKNPDESIHGKGFVARLSGSTIEFISMWKEMFFGKNLYTLEDGELKARFAPALPAYLIGEDKQVSAVYMGNTRVTYHFDEVSDFYPGTYDIREIRITDENNDTFFAPDGIKGEMAEKLRSGAYKSIDIKVAKKMTP